MKKYYYNVEEQYYRIRLSRMELMLSKLCFYEPGVAGSAYEGFSSYENNCCIFSEIF